MDEPYVQIPKALAKDPALGHAALHVYLLLACYANRDGECWPATRTLGGQLAMDRSTVAYHLRSLEARGYLTIERATGRPSRFHLYSSSNRGSHSHTTEGVTPTHRVNGSLTPSESLPHTEGVTHSPTLNENLKNEKQERDTGNERGRTRATPTRTPISPAELESLVTEFAAQLGGPTALRATIAYARTYWASGQGSPSEQSYLRHWLTNDLAHHTTEPRNGTTRQQRPGGVHPPPAAGGADSRRGSGIGIIIPDADEAARLHAIGFHPERDSG